MRFSSGD